MPDTALGTGERRVVKTKPVIACLHCSMGVSKYIKKYTMLCTMLKLFEEKESKQRIKRKAVLGREIRRSLRNI